MQTIQSDCICCFCRGMDFDSTKAEHSQEEEQIHWGTTEAHKNKYHKIGLHYTDRCDTDMDPTLYISSVQAEGEQTKRAHIKASKQTSFSCTF